MNISNPLLSAAESGEHDELNEILSGESASGISGISSSGDDGEECSTPVSSKIKSIRGETPSTENTSGVCQWTSADNKSFFPAMQTVERLLPGAYNIESCMQRGLYFARFEVKTQGLLRFPETNSEAIIREIQTFWEKEALFKNYGLAYKRGILMWGPAGSGKSSLVGILTRDVVERGGIVLNFGHPDTFLAGFRLLRQIEPDKPVVVLMEDIDSTLARYNESDVLNILDGLEDVQRVVFLASTNYPEKLGKRIVNRPSRFDKRFKIGYPNAESRALYLKHVAGNHDGAPGAFAFTGELLARWVKDTDGFSLAHLKELFVAVVILGDAYEDAIKTLSSMKQGVSSDNDEVSSFGLRGRK